MEKYEKTIGKYEKLIGNIEFKISVDDLLNEEEFTNIDNSNSIENHEKIYPYEEQNP